MATAQALRELRCDDRTSLGRHRRLLPPREQSLPRLRRRSQQQNPRPSTPCLWSARSGIPAPQGPDLHAPGALKNPKIHPHDFKKTLIIITAIAVDCARYKAVCESSVQVSDERTYIRVRTRSCDYGINELNIFYSGRCSRNAE